MIAFDLIQAAAARAPEPGLTWNEVVTQYVQFAGYFLSIGAVTYRYLVLPRADVGSHEAGLEAMRASSLGALGVFLLVVAALGGAELNAILHHKGFAESLPKNIGRFQFKIGALVVALAGFGLAKRVSANTGWALAAAGTLAAALQPLVTSVRLAGRVNAIHIAAGSMWLGTLTVMFFAGIRASMRRPTDETPRHLAVARTVNAFSPVALTAAAFVALTGATTAWLHVKRLPNLWETNYGRALIVKLSLVAVVVSLGWWNWKRVRPSLAEGEASMTRIQRSARAEITVAALVLAATAVLVSLPSPR